MRSRRDQLVLFGRDQLVEVAGEDRQEVRRIGWASEILAHEGEYVSYLHAGLCMAALPHRKPTDDFEPWVRTNGRFKLAVWPGRILNKDGSHGQIGVPSGHGHG